MGGYRGLGFKRVRVYLCEGAVGHRGELGVHSVGQIPKDHFREKVEGIGRSFGELVEVDHHAQQAINSGADYLQLYLGDNPSGNNQNAILTKSYSLLEKLLHFAKSERGRFQVKVQVEGCLQRRQQVSIESCEPENAYQISELLQKTWLLRNKNKGYYCIECTITQKKGQTRKIMIMDTTNLPQKQKLTLYEALTNYSYKILSQPCAPNLPNHSPRSLKQLKPYITFNTHMDTISLWPCSAPLTRVLKTLHKIEIPLQRQLPWDNPQDVGDVDCMPVTNACRGQGKGGRKGKEIKGGGQGQGGIGGDLVVEEVRVRRKLRQIRTQIDIAKKKKQLKSFGVCSLETSQMFLNSEEQQLSAVYEKKIKAESELEKVRLSRIQAIERSKSKVEKIKMLKQHLKLQLKNQKQETEDFLCEQSAVSKFYNESINLLQKQLQLSVKQQSQRTVQSRKKQSTQSSSPKDDGYHSVDKYEKHVLPRLQDPCQRRRSMVKHKVLKGRIQFSEFLDKNVQLYKNYSMMAPQ